MRFQITKRKKCSCKTISRSDATKGEDGASDSIFNAHGDCVRPVNRVRRMPMGATATARLLWWSCAPRCNRNANALKPNYLSLDFFISSLLAAALRTPNGCNMHTMHSRPSPSRRHSEGPRNRSEHQPTAVNRRSPGDDTNTFFMFCARETPTALTRRFELHAPSSLSEKLGKHNETNRNIDFNRPLRRTNVTSP